MTARRHIVFLLNLLQDVNIVRPLAYLAARELEVTISILVSARFLERDHLRIWQREVAEMGADLGASVHIYETTTDALGVLQNKRGILIAASESTLSAHADTHNVMRTAPPGFLRITLQHGYECVGFLQNSEHVMAHGRNIKFAADVICGWCEAPALTSLAASERPKLYVSGAPILISAPPRNRESVSGGLVCENLHSVRMRMTGDFGKSFMEQFAQFCDHVGEFGQRVNLRPHPGGMYVVKNNVQLPSNVVLNTRPMYRVDLSAYAFGISAPSTVVFDMVFANIPVAVWRDEDGIMDASNYSGFTAISTPADWLAFTRDAVLRRDYILERQRAFVDELAMPVDPKDVYRRFARLLGKGSTPLGDVRLNRRREPRVVPRRLAFISNGLIPTLQLSFLKPLRPLFESGAIEHRVFTELEASEHVDVLARETPDFKTRRQAMMGDWFRRKLGEFNPELIVFCRYSGPGAEAILGFAKDRNVPVIFHVDDDLLNIPPEIGEAKYLAHNHPRRLATVDTLLKSSDLVYCSTVKLRQRFGHLRYTTPMTSGRIYCSGEILNPAENRPVRRVGYMGFDHEHDFRIVVPELVRYLRRNTEIEFELFGSIPKPVELDEFGDRIVMVEPVRNYEEFLLAFASRQWDIGLCPLARTPFNAVKANTKWVEYTSVGAAVLATRGLVYDECCADGCGELLDTGEWLAALEDLTDNPGRRFEMVARAQARVKGLYAADNLRAQILEVFAEAVNVRLQSRMDEWTHMPAGPVAARAGDVRTRVG